MNLKKKANTRIVRSFENVRLQLSKVVAKDVIAAVFVMILVQKENLPSVNHMQNQAVYVINLQNVVFAM